MKRSTRYLLYVVGSGVLITWLQPPSGLFTVVLVLGLIFASAYLDAWLFPGAESAEADTRQGPGGRRGAPGAKARKGLQWQVVFHTPYQDEVEVLLRDLRDAKLNPLMVTERQEGGDGFIYGVRLLEHEVPRARRVIERFRRHAVKQPS